MINTCTKIRVSYMSMSDAAPIRVSRIQCAMFNFSPISTLDDNTKWETIYLLPPGPIIAVGKWDTDFLYRRSSRALWKCPVFTNPWEFVSKSGNLIFSKSSSKKYFKCQSIIGHALRLHEWWDHSGLNYTWGPFFFFIFAK
jgi:hypothetical protein